MSRVVVIGSSNTDLSIALPRLPEAGQTVLGGRFQSGPGGKGANQAVAARRAGAEVLFVSAVGDDQFGQEAIDHYLAEGIDVSHIKVVQATPSGVALILVGKDGENVIGVAPGANDELTPHDIARLPASIFSPENVLLVSLEIPLATIAYALDRARASGMLAILNPAPAPSHSRAAIRQLLPLARIITPNHDEAAAIADLPSQGNAAAEWEACARCLKSLGSEIVVITVGPHGCFLLDQFPHLIAAPSVTAVDTVAAGDAFNGALAVALLEKSKSIPQALAWANAAAALTVTQAGAQSALPRRAAIDHLASIAPANQPSVQGIRA